VPNPGEKTQERGRFLARRIEVGYFVIREVLGLIKPVEVRSYADFIKAKAEEQERETEEIKQSHARESL